MHVKSIRLGKAWFKYFDAINTHCSGLLEENCKVSMSKVTLQWAHFGHAFPDADKCLNSTFSSWDSEKVNYDKDDNTLLKDMQEEWNKLGSHLYPSFVINNVTYRGQVNADYIFEAACASF